MVAIFTEKAINTKIQFLLEKYNTKNRVNLFVGLLVRMLGILSKFSIVPPSYNKR